MDSADIEVLIEERTKVLRGEQHEKQFRDPTITALDMHVVATGLRFGRKPADAALSNLQDHVSDMNNLFEALAKAGTNAKKRMGVSTIRWKPK